MRNNHLLTEDIPTLIKQIAIPSSIGIFFNTMYNVADTFYAGMISTEAIISLSYGFVVFFMILAVSYGLSNAITAHVGYFLGKRYKTLAKIYVANGITFVSLTSLFLYIIGYLTIEPIFKLIGADGEVLSMAMEYTSIILLGNFPMIIGLGANAVLIACGDSKSYRNTLIIGFFLNIILNPIFMFGYGFIPAFGVEGVAIVTVLVQVLSFLYIMYKLYQTGLLDLSRAKLFLPDLRVYKKIFKQAVPSGLSMFTMSIGTVILTYFVAKYGYKEVAAFGIGYRVEQIALLPLLGLNTAVSSIVANNFGAKNYDRVYEVVKKALLYGYIMSAIGLVFLIIFGKLMVMAFDNDPIVIDEAYTYIVIESIVFFAYTTIFIGTSTLQGIKQPFMIPYISTYRQIVMPCILLFIFVDILNSSLISVWFIMAFIIYSAAIYMFYHTRAQLKKVLI